MMPPHGLLQAALLDVIILFTAVLLVATYGENENKDKTDLLWEQLQHTS